MSAHAYARRPAPVDGPDRQPRLFALPGGAADSPQRPIPQAAVAIPVEPPQRPALAPVPSPAPVSAPGSAIARPAPFESAPEAAVVAPAPAAPGATLPGPARFADPSRTLDAELRLAWTALEAGAPAACIMCGGRMEPRAGASGGSCTSCGTTLE